MITSRELLTNQCYREVTNLVTFLYLCMTAVDNMNIYNRSSIITFYEKQPDCRETLEKWYHDVLSKKWRRPSDVTKDFNTARVVANNRAVFMVNRNDYRLIAEINYLKGWVFIKFIGTHAAYDKVDATKVNLFKNKRKKQ